ncbi:hypothetical protein GCM10029964_105770 [Kibdelosporangium lantanae]
MAARRVLRGRWHGAQRLCLVRRATPPASWTTQPPLNPENEQDGGSGGSSGGGGGGGGGGAPRTPSTAVPPPQGCKDFHDSVIGTCMDTVDAVAPYPNSDPPSGLVGERRSGRVMQVRAGEDPTQLTKLPVDTTGGGGLTGLALSPTYGEDQLIYAYITTATDNRLVRFTQGDSPKPVLTGIPRAPPATGVRWSWTAAGRCCWPPVTPATRRWRRTRSRWRASCCGSTPRASPRRATRTRPPR